SLVAGTGRSFGGKGLPAVVVSARAEDGGIAADNHVTKFARGSANSPIDLAVKNDSGSHSIGDEHKNKIARIPNLGSSKPQLGQSDRIRIIVYSDREPGSLKNCLGNRQIAPFKIRHEDHISS